MDPSFYLLYKRGKYSRQILPPNSEQDPQSQEQRERYAVTAIAFCLTHDQQFRSAFFRTVLGQGSPPKQPNITVEQFPWADLLIETDENVFVVEFKISASVQQNQQLANSCGYVGNIADYARSKAKT